MSSGELEPRRPVPQTTNEARHSHGSAVPPSYNRPDFMIVGITQPSGGVMLFASTELNHAELRREALGFDLIEVPGVLRAAHIPREKIEVRADMRSFTVIIGDDYPSALRSLMEDWARKAKAQQRGING